MKIIEIIQNATETLFSFEILPPKKGDSINSIYQTIDPLMKFNPAFIDVTYHREEVVYQKMEGGLLKKKVVKKRPGTVGISAAIKNKYKVEVVPHIICGGFSAEETENGLIDFHFLGINNLFAIRGDNSPGERHFKPEPEGHTYAEELVQQIIGMNSGKYHENDILETSKTEFSIGVAGYPEKHVESPNVQSDIKYLKKKIDAGAEYIITQMFFDNQKFIAFVQRCREAGITVPIIPGLKPIATKKQLTTLSQTFNIDIPEELSLKVEACLTTSEVKKVGIDWCIQQSKELRNFGVPVLHYYTMSQSDTIVQIAEAVFKK
ncbi:MAG: methylenetetrahydrofolate reductase [NAD(P)H] [Flavobacteriaceae bacterium]|nr:methylenetetrahydrofolate reductase [NAD(P)H] [Flavobacteriaceae bacterium]